MSRQARLAALALLACLLLPGCAVRYQVAGGFDNANEVFRGDIRHDLVAGVAEVVATGEQSGIVCRGHSYITHEPPLAIGCAGQRGRVDMTCDDGRKLDIAWRADSCTAGRGRGADAFGNRFSFSFGLDDAEAEAALRARRIEVSQRPALRGFVPTRTAAAAAPPPAPQSFDRAGAGAGLADFPVAPIGIRYPAVAPRPDDIAVIIANARYRAQGGEIPDVIPAYADAEGFRRYAVEGAGVPAGNVVVVRDATAAEMAYIFGTRRNPRGKLHEWVRPGHSRVHVYFAGHGAPGDRAGRAFLLPADADGSMIAVKGYPLEVLYANLAGLPAAAVTLVLEAGFSGISEGGRVVNRLLPGQRPVMPAVPPALTVLAAAAPGQVASWTADGSQSLFTLHFLTAMGGAADRAPHGDGDGRVGWRELEAYLTATLGQLARQHYGRRQIPSITPARG